MGKEEISIIRISPSQRMELYKEIKEVLFKKYNSYENVALYLEHIFPKVYEYDEAFPDFAYKYRKDPPQDRVIDTERSLAKLDDETLLQIAIDLGIRVPNILYTLPIIHSIMPNKRFDYHVAYEAFEKAIESVFKEPERAVQLANTTLETIIKCIIEQGVLKIPDYDKNDTLYELMCKILKAFEIFPENNSHPEIRKISSSLLKIAQSLEALRSDKTFVHGKGIKDILFDDPCSASFLVNTISTVGLFLITVYEKCYRNNEVWNESVNLGDDDIPF